MPELDFRSGLGHHAQRSAGCGPRYLISDLTQFDFEEDSGRMRLMSLHPGVSLKRLQAEIGFELILPQTIPQKVPRLAKSF